MKLIVGLGNVGDHFANTRHNSGFHIVGQLASQHNLDWRPKASFKAELAEGELFGQHTILIRPTTYYNLSGEAVGAIKQFYKLDLADILVVHDELDLPFGTVRARIGGSDAGNNGIKHISEVIGPDYARLRIGIANEQVADFANTADFVLGHFSTTEQAQLAGITKESLSLIEAFIDDTKKFEHHSVRIESQS